MREDQDVGQKNLGMCREVAMQGNLGMDDGSGCGQGNLEIDLEVGQGNIWNGFENGSGYPKMDQKIGQEIGEGIRE